MGMSIEDIEQWARQNNYTIIADEWWEAAQDTINKYHQLQADYETRLKADMVAMLTEIQLEIREYHEIGCDEDCNNCRMVGCVEPVNVIKDLDIIQQKINAFKENKNERFNT